MVRRRVPRSSCLALALLASTAAAGPQQFGTEGSSGPFGGSVVAVAVDPAAPHTILIGSSNTGGFTRSDGQGWFQFSDAAPTMGSVRAVVADLDVAGRVLAGSSAGLFESLDGGATWAVIPGAPANVNSLAPAPDGQTWLAGTVLELLVSFDDGAHWQWIADQQVFPVVAWSASEPGVGYCGTTAGLLKTVDGGQSFSSPGPDTTAIRHLAVDPSAPGVLYFGTCCGQLLRSADGGATATALTIPVAAPGTFAIDSITRFVACDPLQPERVWLGVGRALHTSDDGGQSWQSASQGIPFGPTSTATPSALAFAPDGGHVLGTAQLGLYQRLPGATNWTQIGMPALPAFGAVLAQPGGKRVFWNATQVFLAEGPQALATGTLPPGPANLVQGTNTVLVDRSDPQRWLFATSDGSILGGKIVVLADEGQQVEALAVFADAGAVVDLVQDPLSPARFLAAVGAPPDAPGLLISENGGASWGAVESSLSMNLVSIDVDPWNPAHWLACGPLGTSGPGSFYETTDDGQTLTPLSPTPGTGSPARVRFDPHLPGVVYFLSSAGLHRSDDGGATWIPLEGPAAGLALAFHPTVPGTLWYGNALGELRLSGDRGDNFVTAWTTPFGSALRALAFDPWSDTLVVGTASESAYEVSNVNPFGVLGGGTGLELEATGGLPQVGNLGFGLALLSPAPLLPCLVYLGLTDLGLPLAGGTLHTGPPEVFLASGLTDANGRFAVSVPIPASPVLVGLQVFAQGFGIDAQAVAGLTLSGGLAVRLLP
jgi:hypothetical protein